MVHQFKDLKSKNGLKELDGWLQSRSYIDGYQPTKADVDAFAGVENAPAAEFAHVLRWFNHIKSFSNDERSRFGNASPAGASADTKPKPKAADADDDFDLFGDEDDEDDEEKERVKNERLKAYADKKAKKPGPIAKSSIVLDIKPWDDETDLAEMEKKVREIACDGLLWAQQGSIFFIALLNVSANVVIFVLAKILPVAFGIKKLQIGCVVEDDKVGVDYLEENITALEDLVQSVDIVAFNKI